MFFTTVDFSSFSTLPDLAGLFASSIRLLGSGAVRASFLALDLFSSFPLTSSGSASGDGTLILSSLSCCCYLRLWIRPCYRSKSLTSLPCLAPCLRLSGSASSAGAAPGGLASGWSSAICVLQVGHWTFCSIHRLKHERWKIWPQRSFFAMFISSRQMMQVVSTPTRLASFWRSTSGSRFNWLTIVLDFMKSCTDLYSLINVSMLSPRR